MLHEALKKAGVTEGSFGFQVIGFHSGIFTENSKYFMSLSAPRERSIRINMKCGKSSKNTVKGVLNFSRGTDFTSLYLALTRAVEMLNEEGWSSLWVREEEFGEEPESAAVLPAHSRISVDAEPPRLVLVSNNESATSSTLESRVEPEKAVVEEQPPGSVPSGVGTVPELVPALTRRQKKLKRLLEERQRLNEQILALIGSRSREEIIAMLLE